MEKGTITAILGSSVGLAGILLVFIGFVYSRVETFEQSDRVRKYRLVAKLGTLPFLLALISAWMCLIWLLVQACMDYCYPKGGQMASFL